jgi:hypothetical protein
VVSSRAKEIRIRWTVRQFLRQFARRFFNTLRNFYTRVEAGIPISLYFILVTMARDLHDPLPLWDSHGMSTMRFFSLKRANRAHQVRPVFS